MSYLRKKKKNRHVRKVSLEDSIFQFPLTRSQFAKILNEPLHVLEGLNKYNSHFVVGRAVESNGKSRPLLYPVSNLRRVNEKIKYQLKKLITPDYLMSPSVGKWQKTNADFHKDAKVVFELDIKTFYPSISRTMIASFFREKCGIRTDVAGLITQLVSTHHPVISILCLQRNVRWNKWSLLPKWL